MNVKGVHGIVHKISVIVPTYCEADNLPSLAAGITDCFAASGLAGNEIEILVVDDDSPDGTKEVCRSLTDRYPAVRLITRVGERGLGTAVKRGIEESNGDVLVVMDADLSHDPAVIPRLVSEILDSGVDAAIASRFACGGRMHSSIRSTLGSMALNAFVSILLHLPAKDVTGGFFALKEDALQGLDLDAICRGYGDYSFALLYRGVKQGWKTTEVGFDYRPRRQGISKTRFLGAGLSYGIRAIRLRLGLG